ncbi:Uncharacterised protein [Serratia liquefaciens]|nr:Uncharacterised protein [Serratia liquefaciens]
MPTYLFLRRLRRSPAAFSGLTLVLLLVLTALFARGWRRHDPNWQDAALVCRGPGRDTGSAPTATAATCCRACSTAPARRWVWWRW